jgi:hypothetical protein
MTIEKKKHDSEASNNGGKKDPRLNRVLSMPHREPERSDDIRHRQRYLPPNLCDDPSFAVHSDQ